MAGTTDPRLRYREGDIVPTLFKTTIPGPYNFPGPHIRITRVRTEPLGAMTEDDARAEGFGGAIESFREWWAGTIGSWQADREVVVLEFELIHDEPGTAPPLAFHPRFFRAIYNGEKTQTRRNWLNDEPKNIGLQQEPADTHLTTDGEQT